MVTSDPETAALPGDGAEEAPEAEEAPRSSASRWLVELAVLLVVVVGLTLVLRTFVIQTFSIPSGSMLPTLQIGDRIVVDKLSYDLHGVHRGDVVVFKRPPLEEQDYPDLVKRVVGLPGDLLSEQNGEIYIGGHVVDGQVVGAKPLPEPWLPKGPQALTVPIPGDPHPQFNLPPQGVRVPAGEYFVMGDNRRASEDSRWFGPIPGSLIVGRAVAVVWPFSQIKGL